MKVYAVHTTRIDNVGAMAAVFNDRKLAEAYACGRSGDAGIICSAVTSFEINQLGTRNAICWYQNGQLMQGNWPTPHSNMRPLHQPPGHNSPAGRR